MRAASKVVLPFLFAAHALHAQVVRGVVITPDSALVPGVIVTLVDSKGTPVARALADDGGAYSMRAPAAGSYRIEARRLAFRPTLDVPISLSEGKVLLHTLVLTGAPVQLTAVRTTAEPRCENGGDSTSAALAVWEAARTALRASQLTRLTRAYTMDVTTYVRRQSIAAQRWRNTDSTKLEGIALRPFTSRPAAELAERGYVEHGAQRDVFHAPDEDVLLSESFAATHCLRVLPDSANAGIIRLGFSPLPDRRQTEITGVLSIDRASSELRRLDFTFVNLPVAIGVGAPGGEIIFRHLSEGSWLIEQWAIWLPIVEERAEMPLSSSAVARTQAEIRRAPPPAIARVGFQTTGGRVDRVSFRDETIWLRPRADP
ncbi:MAG: hypothetical protein JWM95_2276 [Gemmatimonadetes bacterium]|nr:hypothetical protein [Gemmatimonadota bacterium]